MKVQNMRIGIQIILFRQITALINPLIYGLVKQSTIANRATANVCALTGRKRALFSCNVRQIILNILFTNSISSTSFRRRHYSNV